MALKTLEGVAEIGGFAVGKTLDVTYVAVDQAKNTIAFKIQDGPVGQKGVNGCQVDTIIETAMVMLQGLDKEYPCDENKRAISALSGAIMHLNQRREDRERRGVEGKNLA